MVALPAVKTLQEQCPWCAQPISHAKFQEISAKIAEAERRRTAAIEHRLRAESANQLAEVEAKTKADIEAVRAQAASKIEEAQTAASLAQAAGREEGKKLADASLAAQVTTEQQARRAAEEKVALQQANQDAMVNARVAEAREALEQANAKALSAVEARNFQETTRLITQVQHLERQLQKKTADELGEGAEVDLFDALRTAFPHDDIKRVKKGAEGVDIVHEVLQSGRVCGTLVYDSKNRSAWRNEYVEKLHKDQLAAKADHAILATRVFPAGERQICIRDNVILANPARVVTLVQLLRRHVVADSNLRLSRQARDQKMDKLYDFITSDRFAQLLARIDTAAEDLLDLDVKEQKAHGVTWKRRGELIHSVEQAKATLSTEVDMIVNVATSLVVVDAT